MISHKNYIQKLHKRASMLQWILGRFGFLQNSFEMRLAKNRIDQAPLNETTALVCPVQAVVV